MAKLEAVGIKGKVLEIIKTIYDAEDRASVKIGNKCSPPFRTNMGVRQGCVLSPTLFNIFLENTNYSYLLFESLKDRWMISVCELC